MTCENASTTLLWLYGEAPDEHAAHVSTCAECQALLAQTELVTGALGDAADALRATGPPSVIAEVAPMAAPANRPTGWFTWLGGGVAMALAAAGLFAVLLPSPTVEPAIGPEVAMVDTGAPAEVATLWDDDLDWLLADLDQDVDDLEVDLWTL